jgi:hypothetical protein
MKKLTLALYLSLVASSADAQYLGRLSSNPYLPDSTSNPYGRYGSPYSPDSINNPYGRYGSKYSNESVNNPYALNPPRIGSDGSIYGGE